MYTYMIYSPAESCPAGVLSASFIIHAKFRLSLHATSTDSV